MTAQSLRTYTLKDLVDMARKRGVNGWHGMRKDQLVRALLKPAGKRAVSPAMKSAAKKPVPVSRAIEIKRSATSRSGTSRNTTQRTVTKRSATQRSASHRRVAAVSRNGTVSRTGAVSRNGVASRPAAARAVVRSAPRNPRLVKRLEQAKVRLMRAKILATEPATNGAAKDRLVVMVRGPFWLHAYWELTPTGIVRAQAALGELWHNAKPVLRLISISSAGSSSSSERVARDIAIHGGVKNWYVDVIEPPQSYRLEIGYLAANGRFFSLARSNTVSTPASASSDKLDNHWTDVVENCDKIYAMSGGYSPEVNTGELQEVLEERLRRPVGGSVGNRYGGGAEALVPRERTVRFDVDAEMIVHGNTHPDAHVTLQGEPIKLRADGSFSVRLDLPNRRQVIPIVASTRDGTSQRTIVLAVERNTKIMEPVTRESTD